MLAYFCSKCMMYFQEMELLSKKCCPECKQDTKPRLILGGQVMGNTAGE